MPFSTTAQVIPTACSESRCASWRKDIVWLVSPPHPHSTPAAIWSSNARARETRPDGRLPISCHGACQHVQDAMLVSTTNVSRPYDKIPLARYKLEGALCTTLTSRAGCLRSGRCKRASFALPTPKSSRDYHSPVPQRVQHLRGSCACLQLCEGSHLVTF